MFNFSPKKVPKNFRTGLEDCTYTLVGKIADIPQEFEIHELRLYIFHGDPFYGAPWTIDRWFKNTGSPQSLRPLLLGYFTYPQKKGNSNCQREETSSGHFCWVDAQPNAVLSTNTCHKLFFGYCVSNNIKVHVLWRCRYRITLTLACCSVLLLGLGSIHIYHI